MSVREELKCDVAFPIEGFQLDVKNPFSTNNVTFELSNPGVFPTLKQTLEEQNIKAEIKILGVVRQVSGKDVGEIWDSAYQVVDSAVNIIQFLVTPRLRTVREVFFNKRLDGDIIDSGFKIMIEQVASIPLYGLFPGPKFDAQKYMEEKLKPINAIRDEKRETLERALSYYTMAVSAHNYYQAIESFFSAIQAIVKPGEYVSSDTRTYMKPIIIKKTRMTDKEFSTKFNCYWGKYRSGASHGSYPVNDYSRLREVSLAKHEVAKWTYFIIDDFIQRFQKST